MANFVESFHNKPLGVALKELRFKKGKTIDEVTKPCGATISWLQKHESGQNEKITAKTSARVYCIFEQLGASYDDYLFSQEPSTLSEGSTEVFSPARQLTLIQQTLGTLRHEVGLLQRDFSTRNVADTAEKSPYHPDNY